MCRIHPCEWLDEDWQLVVWALDTYAADCDSQFERDTAVELMADIAWVLGR